MHRVKSQRKLDRYARYVMQQPCKWLAAFDLAYRHAPKNLRQYTADQIMLRITQMEYQTC